MEYAEEGTEFYCVVEYPSGIHRVQKLVSGSNGQFFQMHDGTWMASGMYCRAYTPSEIEEAQELASELNVREIKSSEFYMESLKNRISSIKSYMIGRRK